MSDQHGRPDSSKSRQELLDEIYYLRDIAGERGEQIQLLKRAETEEGARAIVELDRVLHSRSWRWTAPLRCLTRVLGQARHADAWVASSGGPPRAASDADSGFQRHVDAVHSSPRVASLEVRQHGERRFYVDVSELVLHHGRTGVQRVTREILRALLASPPPGFVVQPVCAPPGQPYQTIDHFEPPAQRAGEAAGALIDPRAGDLFLGLDHSMQATIARTPDLEKMHRNGVRIWFICNDVLPLEHPEWFPAEVPPRFEAWLRIVLSVADGVACISLATKSALHQRRNVVGIVRERPLEIVHFALGSDLPPRAREPASAGETPAPLDSLQDRTKFLMVGTIEPRKGHAQALQAFERLWASGKDIALVIVGLPGWQTEVVQRRIRHHDEFGRRLFWFADADDTMLGQLYASCTALLAPSQGEGFGLPLVEAARHGLPILCRDLPVFREIAGDRASYFSGDDPGQLADALSTWLEANRHGETPSSEGIRHVTWDQSARELLGVILGQDVAQEHPGSLAR